VIGVFMWHVPPFVASLVSLTPGACLRQLAGTIRIMGVLQRLALCYGIGSTLALLVSRRALVATGAVLLLAYWYVMWAFGQGADPYSSRRTRRSGSTPGCSAPVTCTTASA
jgi:hypothetical protein